MADPNKGAKSCASKIKDDSGNLLPCPTMIPKGVGDCPNRREHVAKYVTGFCLMGSHEGTKPRGASGKPLQVCQAWKHCPCSCHSDIDELFAMSGKPRFAQENPEYHIDRGGFVMPTPEMVAADNRTFTDGGASHRVVVEAAAPDVTPPVVTRTFAPTPTGRAGRGQLELWVQQACDEWLIEKPGEPCTPAYIAAWIIRYKAVPTQSQGAVNAVFERWTALGFAVIEKKPTRFVKYTDEGIRLGLDAMRQRAKRTVKRAEDLKNKGVRV